MRILCVLSGSGNESSVSSNLARHLVDRLRKRYPSAIVITRDLHLDPPPHWTAPAIRAAFTPPHLRTEQDQALLKRSQELCDELARADALIIASPMWNFSVPSVLKAWIDHIVRVGVTFQYDQGTPKGLLNALKITYLIESTGGTYQGSPMESFNHVGPYLEQVFKFLGSKEIVRISAQGTAVDPTQALEHGMQQIQTRVEESARVFQNSVN